MATPQKKTHWRRMIPSDVLCAADLQGQDVTVVVEKIVAAKRPNRENPQKEDHHLNFYFKGKHKPLEVKATGCKTMHKLFGSPAPDDWIGKAITIYGTTTRAFGETWEVIRIRPQKPGGDAAKEAASRPADPTPAPSDLPKDLAAGESLEMSEADRRAIEMEEASRG